jgi:predicted TIM-barrel fold metal-dependent hydrolase
VSLPIRLGDRFDFPWRETWPFLRELVDRVGADQLMWGTDMPFQDRFCTYRQSRDWLERYAPLGGEERSAILGGTAARLLRIREVVRPS